MRIYHARCDANAALAGYLMPTFSSVRLSRCRFYDGATKLLQCCRILLLRSSVRDVLIRGAIPLSWQNVPRLKGDDDDPRNPDDRRLPALHRGGCN